MEGIRKVQARRKEEMVGMANRNHSSASRVQDNKGKLRLCCETGEFRMLVQWRDNLKYEYLQ